MTPGVSSHHSRLAAALEEHGPHGLGALQLAAAFRSGILDVGTHTSEVIDRARARGPRVGAFSSLCPELSRQQAAGAYARLAAPGGAPHAPALLGVPFPVKDLVEVDGLPFEAGSLALRGTVSTRTDGVAQRMLDAGTVTIGKTTTSEFGMSVFSESPAGAPARTPWDTRRTAGGSSGGAGSAVAAGIVPIAHGNDAGGSIRVPAACNGLVGIVPGRGFASWGPFGLDGVGLARHGVLARSVDDAAAGMRVIGADAPGDHFAWAGDRALPLAEPSSLRMGVMTEPMVAHTEAHRESLAALDRAVEALRALGHSVVKAGPAMTPEEWQTFMPVWSVGAARIPLPWGPAGTPEARAGEEKAGVGALTRWLRAAGSDVSGVEYAGACATIQSLTRRIALQWHDLDLILTPTLSGPPVVASDIPTAPADDFAFQSRFTPWTSVWNMTGWAAMSVPVHRARVDGTLLPFGVHLGATRPGQEALLLSVARQLERVDPWPHPFVNTLD